MACEHCARLEHELAEQRRREQFARTVAEDRVGNPLRQGLHLARAALEQIQQRVAVHSTDYARDVYRLAARVLGQWADTVDDAPTAPEESALARDLAAVLNTHCAENASNTPDFILAQYLLGCLAAYNTAVQQRTTWCGRCDTPAGRRR